MRRSNWRKDRILAMALLLAAAGCGNDEPEASGPAGIDGGGGGRAPGSGGQATGGTPSGGKGSGGLASGGGGGASAAGNGGAGGGKCDVACDHGQTCQNGVCSPTLAQSCASVCAAITDPSLDSCRYDQVSCNENCTSHGDVAPPSADYGSMVRCLARLPASDWFCSADAKDGSIFGASPVAYGPCERQICNWNCEDMALADVSAINRCCRLPAGSPGLLGRVSK